MSLIDILKFIATSFRDHKSKIAALIFSCFLFLLILFPFDDLGDFVSTQVSNVTGNSIFIQFERLSMSLFPQPGAELEKVYIESLNTPALTATSLTITPSLSGIINKKPYGHVSAEGLLKGKVDLHVDSGKRSDKGTERNKIELQAQKVSLLDIRQLVNLPIMLKGNVDIQSTALADFTLSEQPEVELSLSINQFEIPPSNINTSFGPLTVPELKLSRVELKGRLAAGRFTIESGSIGKEKDDVFGNIKGTLDLNFQNTPAGPMPHIGGYNFDIDLKAYKSFQTRAALFLTFIDTYKTTLPDGAQYKFRVAASSTDSPPQIGPVR